MENEEIIEESTVDTEDSTEALLEEYDRRLKNKPDDIIAMQTVVCILLSALLFGANYLYPETVGELAGKLCTLVNAADSLPNPIDLIAAYFERL